MRSLCVFTCLGLSLAAFSQPRRPDTAAQREAMQKLDFLAGRWTGQAKVSPGPGQPTTIEQTEDVQFRMDGLVLVVEGTGRSTEGRVVFRALGVISYDDAAGAYHIRAYSDGMVTDSELKLAPQGFKGFDWGFAAGPARVSYVMRLNANGDWVETGEMRFGGQPARQIVDMRLTRGK